MSASGLEQLPKTMEAVKTMIPPKKCSACGQKRITHTVNCTTTELLEGGDEEGKAGKVILRLKAELCEPCAATVNALFRRSAKV